MLCRRRGGLKLGEGRFGLGRWNVADRLEQPAVIVPFDPLERGVVDGLDPSP